MVRFGVRKICPKNQTEPDFGSTIVFPAGSPVLTSCVDDLRFMMLSPKHPPSLDNGSWSFHTTDAPKSMPKKAVSYVLEKVIHRFKKPTDLPEYPKNVIWILHKMLKKTQFASVQESAVKCLHILAAHGWSWTLLMIGNAH